MSEGSLTSVETRQNLSRLIPPEIADILGPVLSTENRQAYDALMTQLERHQVRQTARSCHAARSCGRG